MVPTQKEFPATAVGPSRSGPCIASMNLSDASSRYHERSARLGLVRGFQEDPRMTRP